MSPTPSKRKTDRKSPERASESAPLMSEPNGLSSSEIARRAFEIYCARGYQPGHELDDWLQAEGELRASIGAAATKASRPRRRRPASAES